jgi:uncharacterized protein YdaT
MGKKNDVHVVRRGDEWAVRRENAERDSSHHPTQGDAIDKAREIAKRDGLEVVIHRPDGRIRDKDSYGPDPHPPKDKKH